jgi:cobalt-zinc-cadmium efflux system protein
MTEQHLGYLRWEILAALVNGAVLFGLAGWVVIEAIGRINHPAPIQGGLFFGIAAAGLLVNVVALGAICSARWAR